jgi:CHAT domain-containing protein/tetratricopeptide (TPR) repeat protein
MMPLLLACPAVAQSNGGAASPGLPLPPSPIQPGIVVEAVSQKSVAEKAGLQNGDVLLRWTRSETKGTLESPFELSRTETEQGPIGTVVLEGLRGAETQVWSLAPGEWGLTVRPNLNGAFLTLYQEGQELATAGKVIEGAERWRRLAGQLSGSSIPWLSAWLFFQAADVLVVARRWKEADDAYQFALQQAEKTDPRIAYQLLQAWARSYARRSDWANAEKYFQQSIAESRRAGGGELGVASSLAALGGTFGLRGDVNKSEEYYRQALDIREKLAPGSLEVAKSLNNLGIAAMDRGNLPKAEEYYRQALGIREKLAPDSVDVAASFNNLGIVASQRGDQAKAEEYFLQALDIRKKLTPGSLEVASNLNNLGIAASERGDPAKAEEYYRQALEIKQKLVPGSLTVAGTLNNLGSATWKQGELATAEKYYRQALDIQQKLAPGGLDIAKSFINLGTIALDRGELTKAEEYYREALDIQQKLAPGSLDVAASFHTIADVASDQGDLAKAEEYYRLALAIQQKLAPESLDLAASLNNLGTLARDRGELAKAEEYYRQALDMKRKLAPESLDVARSLNNVGEIVFDRGEFAKAEEHFRQALNIQQKLAPESLDTALSFQCLGESARRSGDLGKAEAYQRQALAIREKLAPGSLAHAESLAAVAAILRETQQVDMAAQLYAQAINTLEEQTAHLGGSEELRSGFRARHSSIYGDYIDLLLSQRQPELAFEALERSRAQGLISMLNAARIDVHNGVDAGLLARKRSLSADLQAKSNRRIELLTGSHSKDQIATVENEIAKLRGQTQEAEEQIRAKSPGYAALTHPLSLSTKELQQLLDPETVLLEYFLGEERSHLFVLTSESLRSYELAKGAEIEKAARRVHDLLTARVRKIKGETEQERIRRRRKENAEYPQAVLDLSTKVLAPVPMPPGKKHMLIVADGALQYIPFAALPTPVAWNTKKQSALPGQQPLVANYDIVGLPSAQTLAVLRQQVSGRPEAPKAVAVLADPVFAANDVRIKAPRNGHAQKEGPTPDLENKGLKDKISSPDSRSTERLTRSLGDVGRSSEGQLHLPRLSFSRQEAKDIVSAVPAGQALEALDFKASRQTATSPELAQYRIVHFATHGVLDSVHPELSGLVLSMVDEQGERQNGFLDLEDVYNLNLPVDLVVLSACETGLGKEIHGEGLIGLTRGFMYAGAARVVASLWEVDDMAAGELMGRFYQAMEKQGMRPAAALRHAQIQMWKQTRWSSPYYWAAFQMQGEWR